MKKRMLYLFLAALFAAFLAGCKTVDDASGTVPWGHPADFEGAGVGLPNLSEGQ